MRRALYRGPVQGLSLVSVYLPSGSSSEDRQRAKFRFMAEFMPYLRTLRRKRRNFILCGDWNIAHRPIDLRNWRSNQKNSGFLPEERVWLDELFDEVRYVDAFRERNAEPDQYTWWSNRGQAWAKNVGWRIDYQVLSPRSRQRSRGRHPQAQRFSDHAPLTIDYDLERAGRRQAAVEASSVWRGWLERSRISPPARAGLLFLGFSAGCRSCGVTHCRRGCANSAIDRRRSACSPGSVSLYAQFFWAPVVVRLRFPVSAAARAAAAAGCCSPGGIVLVLLNVAHTTPVGHLGALVGFTLLIAFPRDAGHRDRCLAHRAAPQPMQASWPPHTSGLSHRDHVASAGPLDRRGFGCTAGYTIMAALVGVGILTTLVIPEPEPRAPVGSVAQEQRVSTGRSQRTTARSCAASARGSPGRWSALSSLSSRATARGSRC